jgi:hypothetical protein
VWKEGTLHARGMAQIEAMQPSPNGPDTTFAFQPTMLRLRGGAEGEK